MPEFITDHNGGARLLLDDAETDIIRGLVDELRTLIAGGRIDRGDPVYDRLFPSAYEEAKDEAAYRELIGDDLVTHKVEALDAISGALGPGANDIPLEGESLDTWLSCLTDMRLAIGTRIDIDEERMAAEIDPKHPDARALAVLHWLGWIQEGVLQACADL
jgi:hypothetical protein